MIFLKFIGCYIPFILYIIQIVTPPLHYFMRSSKYLLYGCCCSGLLNFIRQLLMLFFLTNKNNPPPLNKLLSVKSIINLYPCLYPYYDRLSIALLMTNNIKYSLLSIAMVILPYLEDHLVLAYTVCMYK